MTQMSLELDKPKRATAKALRKKLNTRHPRHCTGTGERELVTILRKTYRKKQPTPILTDRHCGWDWKRNRHSGFGCQRVVGNLACRYDGNLDGLKVALMVCGKCHGILTGERKPNGQLKVVK